MPKEHWKVMPSTEKLTDPKVIKDAEKEESKRRSNEIVRLKNHTQIKSDYIIYFEK